MSLTADLFFSTNAARETLHRRITPTDDQFEDQKARWNDLAVFLKARLKDEVGYSTSTWLQGSYKSDTQIRPWSSGAQFDIDLGLFLEWAGLPEDGDLSPRNLKACVQQALIDYQSDGENDATGVDDPKERCCRISFNPDFHIDVPCYHLDPERDARALATQTEGWELSDPKAIYQWFKRRYDDAPRRAQLRRQIRYLKMWAALNFKDADRPSSITLTVLAAEALEGYAIQGVADDDLLEHVAIVIHERLGASAAVPNPVARSEDLNRLNDPANRALVASLADLKDTAARARQAQDKGAAAENWAECFGQFFPMPEDNDEKIAKAEGATNQIALYAFEPQVEVLATPKRNAHRTWSGLNDLPTIPKDCEIRFRLRNAGQLPVGASLRWTVRNRGDEAVRLNDLGHPAGNGVEITERSAYNGDHAMDLTVNVGAQVVGRRRIWVRVRGLAMPPRNKARRRFFG